MSKVGNAPDSAESQAQKKCQVMRNNDFRALPDTPKEPNINRLIDKTPTMPLEGGPPPYDSSYRRPDIFTDGTVSILKGLCSISHVISPIGTSGG